MARGQAAKASPDEFWTLKGDREQWLSHGCRFRRLAINIEGLVGWLEEGQTALFSQ